MKCSCVLVDSAVLPPVYDSTDCPTHGPNAPRYFVDHGVIHDRVTGKHVDAEEAAALLNGAKP